MTADNELLRRYAETNSEEAFRELVRRHVQLVYSAALRQVNGDAHLAQDVAQTVFSDLARKAGSLSRRGSLTGWLYTSAHFAAAKIARTENRRRDREEKFMREPIPETAPGADWEKIRPTLDEAMHELRETDREAVLLRYFENRPFAEVGAKLGLGENAARMRVDRALEKLRGILSKRGVTTATALASVISANAVQMAPANLAAALAAASMATAGAGTATFTLFKIMTATQLKLGVSALVVAGATTAFVIQHQTQNELRLENESLRQRVVQLQSDNETVSNRLAETGSIQKLSENQFDELLNLRGEAGRLRAQNEDLAKLQRENLSLKQQKSMLEGMWNNITNGFTVRGPYFRRESWSDVGSTEPDKALVTLLWALKDNDTNKVFELVPTIETGQNLKLLSNQQNWNEVKGVSVVLVTYSQDGSGEKIAYLDTIIEKQHMLSPDQKSDFQSAAVQDYLATHQVLQRWLLKEVDGKWQFTGMY